MKSIEEAPVSRAVSHIIELACLQGRLLIADVKEGAQTAKLAAALGLASLAFLIAAAPTLLAALAFYLRNQLGYSIPFALLLSALAAILAGALLGFAAWRTGRRGASTAVKSYDDFEKNLQSLTRSS